MCYAKYNDSAFVGIASLKIFLVNYRATCSYYPIFLLMETSIRILLIALRCDWIDRTTVIWGVFTYFFFPTNCLIYDETIGIVLFIVIGVWKIQKKSRCKNRFVCIICIEGDIKCSLSH